MHVFTSSIQKLKVYVQIKVRLNHFLLLKNKFIPRRLYFINEAGTKDIHYSKRST